MGEVIRKDADPAEIFADVKTTYTRAKARQGIWEARAEERIGPVVGLINLIEGQTTEAQTAYEPLSASVDAMDEKADKFLEGVAEEVHNHVGRPHKDVILEVVFPQQGAGQYTQGENEDQPARMELLARLLDLGVHPRLDPAKAQEISARIRAVAADYQGVLNAAAEPRDRLRFLLDIREVLAPIAQISLSHLKRSYKTEGFSEVEIHNVIPDRPRPPRKAPTP